MSDLDEELRELSIVLARIIVRRGFADGPASRSSSSKSDARVSQTCDFTDNAVDAEGSLLQAQRLAEQLESDGDKLSAQILPRLRSNAQQLEEVFSAVDMLADHVMPAIEDNVARMEEAMSRCEAEKRGSNSLVDALFSAGSFGLGSPWGAEASRGRPRAGTGDDGLETPYVFDTGTLFTGHTPETEVISL